MICSLDVKLLAMDAQIELTVELQNLEDVYQSFCVGKQGTSTVGSEVTLDKTSLAACVPKAEVKGC